jgi:hypothetical protein
MPAASCANAVAVGSASSRRRIASAHPAEPQRCHECRAEIATRDGAVERREVDRAERLDRARSLDVVDAPGDAAFEARARASASQSGSPQRDT